VTKPVTRSGHQADAPLGRSRLLARHSRPAIRARGRTREEEEDSSWQRQPVSSSASSLEF